MHLVMHGWLIMMNRMECTSVLTTTLAIGNTELKVKFSNITVVTDVHCACDMYTVCIGQTI